MPPMGHPIGSGDSGDQYFRGSAAAESLVTLRSRHSVAPQHGHRLGPNGWRDASRAVVGCDWHQGRVSMRYGLLCTSALISAGFVASQAQAADPIKLTLGGFYGTAAGAEIGGNNANGSPSDNRQVGAFKQNVEIYFNGSTTLDNGLTAGVHVELEGNNTPNRTEDELFAYFKGGFGEFRFGDTGGALGKSCVVDPGAITNNFGLISPNNSFSNVGRNTPIGLGGMGTCEDHGNGTKAVYFSPVFSGF